MSMKHRGLGYLRSGLTVLLGAGATLGTTFLISRLKEKQDTETRMDRLEQMIDDLGGTKPKAPAKARPAKATPAKPKTKP
jgi:hypothetical protein